MPSSSSQQQQEPHERHRLLDESRELLDESREMLLHTGETVGRKVRSFWEGFSDFALQDNVLEIALGLIFASAFTEIVNSLVSDIILPPFSLLPFLGKNLDEKFAVLKPGGEPPADGYNTIGEAQHDGAVVLAYGKFIEKTVRFFVLGLSLYSLALLYQLMSHDVVIKRKVKCKYCRKYISAKATRCLNCTTWQDGREDR